MVYAWVIEHGDSEPCAPRYFTGESARHGRWHLCNDVAVRFARKQDADRIALALGLENVRIAEHGWYE